MQAKPGETERQQRKRRLLENLLVPMMYDELRGFARRVLRRLPPMDIEATDAVHEATLRIIAASGLDLDDPAQLMAILKVGIRHVINDQLRRRAADKRGGGRSKRALDEKSVAALRSEQVIQEVDDAIEKLAADYPRAARVVRAHIHEGRPFEEIARLLGVSRKTAVQDWALARAFLLRVFQSDTRPYPHPPKSVMHVL